MDREVKIVPSIYQEEIDRVFVSEPNVNILVAAVAGSGKTTTLLSLLKKVKGDAKYLAFNKSIVEELEEKTGFIPRVKIQTLHSLGMGGLIRTFGKIKLDDKNKTTSFIIPLREEWGFSEDQFDPSDPEYAKKKEDNHKIWWKTVFQIKDLYNIFRLKMCTSISDLSKVCDNLGLEYTASTLSKTLHIHQLISKYNQNPKVIDFTDMVYLPATDKRITFRSPTVTFIDECQDLNEAQHRLINKVIGGNRWVACGDRAQSIYGFSGADSKSFDRFLEKDRVRELPLSVCYRCGSDIVEHANTVYNIMEPFEGNDSGTVEMDGDVLSAIEKDMVICRNTAPLVKTYFEFLKIGKTAYVKGKDIGANLIFLVSKFKVHTSSQLEKGLEEHLFQIEEELKELGIENPKVHPRYVAFQEKKEILQIFTRRYYTVTEVKKELERMFKDKSKGVILSTIHKSKGLEAENVYFLDSHLLPSQYAETDEQLVQETNLRYVAITRAKKKLTYCRSKE